MQLHMTAGARDLPPADHVIETGGLGYCSAVIVMWERNGHGQYQHVRGWHGSGGVGEIKFHVLLNGVPPNDPHILICFVIGSSNGEEVAHREMQRFEQRLPQAFRNCQIRCFGPVREAAFDRFGKLLRTEGPSIPSAAPMVLRPPTSPRPPHPGGGSGKRPAR